MRQKVIWSILLSAVVFLLAASGKEESSGQGEAQWNSGDYQREFLPVEQGDMILTDIILAEYMLFSVCRAEQTGRTAAGNITWRLSTQTEKNGSVRKSRDR